MKRKILLLITIVSMLLFTVSCKDEKTLTLEVPQSVQAAYLTEFELPVIYASDNKGEKYLSVISVKDSEGRVVETENGKFLIEDLNGYTVTYTVTVEEITLTKVMKIVVVDETAPVITYTGEEEYFYNALKEPVWQIPVDLISVTDDVTEQPIVTYSVKLGEKEISVSDGAFLIEQEGLYEVTIKAEDEYGNISTKTFTVVGYFREDEVVADFEYDFDLDILEHETDPDAFSIVEKDGNKVLKVINPRKFFIYTHEFDVHKQISMDISFEGLDIEEFSITGIELDGSTYYPFKEFYEGGYEHITFGAGDYLTNKYKGLKIEVYFSNENVTMYIDNIKITDRPKDIILKTNVYNYFRTTDDEKTIDVTGLACIGYSEPGYFIHLSDEVEYTVYEGYGTEGSEVPGDDGTYALRRDVGRYTVQISDPQGQAQSRFIYYDIYDPETRDSYYFDFEYFSDIRFAESNYNKLELAEREEGNHMLAVHRANNIPFEWDATVEIKGINIDAQVTFDLDFDNISDPFTVRLLNYHDYYIDYTYDTWEGKKTFSMTLSKSDTLVIVVYYGNESTQAIMYLDNIAVSYDLKPEIRINAEGYAPNSFKLIERTQDIYTITFNEIEFAGIYYEGSDEKVRDVYISCYRGYGKGDWVTRHSGENNYVSFELNANNRYTLVVYDSEGAAEEIFIYFDVIKDRGIFLDFEYYSDIQYITAIEGECDIVNKSGNYMLKMISEEADYGHRSFISIDISSIKSDLVGKKVKINCKFDNGGEDIFMRYQIYCEPYGEFVLFDHGFMEAEDFVEVTTKAIDDEYNELYISFRFDNPDTIAYIDFEIVEA